MSDAYRLSFLLPKTLLLLVPEGRHQPCLAGCTLTNLRGLVEIVGPSRERVFDQARRFFRVHARKLPAFTVAATLYCGPARRGRDCWTIAINSEVTFSPTGLGAHVDAPPALTILSAG